VKWTDAPYSFQGKDKNGSQPDQRISKGGGEMGQVNQALEKVARKEMPVMGVV